MWIAWDAPAPVRGRCCCGLVGRGRRLAGSVASLAAGLGWTVRERRALDGAVARETGVPRRLTLERSVQAVVARPQLAKRHHLLDLGPGRIEMRQDRFEL